MPEPENPKQSLDTLNLTKLPPRNFNTSLSPPALVDVRKKIRSSGAGGLVICTLLLS
jgi:hypothetical protein